MRLLVGFLVAAALLGQSRPPHLMLTPDDFTRIAQGAVKYPWMAGVRDGIVTSARGFPADHLKKYGLTEWKVPAQGGQWTLWYVCPVHGVSLRYTPPSTHQCPVDNKTYTGKPYDQVIYTRRNTDNAASARDNALAYRFMGDINFARTAARILLAYADIYASYPIHDTNDRINATSGARATAQTLDEAIWLIPLAWSYDLIADSGVLSDGEKQHIERDLLRAAVTVIARNDAKMSNWQSWHNAGMGAVGFALNDQSLITKVIDGPSGFRYQMANSVFDEGFWYEGSWGYHFYALDAHVQLAEMAARNGIDIFSEPNLRKMFEAPQAMALPDLTLPQFNDSGATSLTAQDRLYEVAYKRYNDASFAMALGKNSRGNYALFWGAESLDAVQLPKMKSVAMPDAGYVIFRNDASDLTTMLKFGPHGGGHGHYDKLNFISYVRGGIAGVDPGTQSYAAPTHNTWDKVTVSHNTVVVDEKTQAEATGALEGYFTWPTFTVAAANAGPAYKQATLRRVMYQTSNYLLDIFTAKSNDGAEHQFDWVYHNYGTASTDLPLQDYKAFPATEGYQHLTENRAASTAEQWQVEFDMNPAGEASYGSVYKSSTAVNGTFTYNLGQTTSGNFSGKAVYDFSAGQGYLLFSTPALTNLPKEVPTALSMMIYGDNSGHKLVLRLNDDTDERFVYTVGNIDWAGWKRIEVVNPATWSHYLGNENGIFDGPVRTVSIELGSVAGAMPKGTLFIDDITLTYASRGAVVVADFERTLRGMRVTMAGAPGTTVVVGKGLGPELLQPVPYVMARRRAKETQFVALYEPNNGNPPTITAVIKPLGLGQYVVQGAGFVDHVRLLDGHCPVMVTRYLSTSGLPGVSEYGCVPGKFTPRNP